MAKYDLAIAGGGPGGAYAARTAALLGLKTVFFERGGKAGEKNSSGCGLGQRWWRDFPDEMEAIVKLPSYREITHCAFKITDEEDNLVATLSTGHTLNVPLFVEEGEWLKVDTRSGEYVERVKR